MISKDIEAVLCDYFTASELVELLDVKTEDLFYTFSDEIEDAMEDLLEIVGYKEPDSD